MKRRLLPGVVLLLGLLLAACRAPAPSPAPPGVPAAGWTLLVREAGPYWLGPDWWRARGLDPTSLDPANIRLQHDGADASFWWQASSGGPGLLFLGEVEPGRLGPSGGYHLTVGEQGAPPYDEAATLVPPATFQSTTIAATTLEVDNIYRPTAPGGSNWLWTSFNANPTLTLTLPLTAVVDAAPVTLSLHFWGQSSMPQEPDHHVRVLWNGTVVDDHFWDGNGAEAWEITVAEAKSGDNELTLVSPGDTEAPVEVSWLDKVGVTWQRRMTYNRAGWETWVAGDAPAACWEGVPETPVTIIVAGTDGDIRAATGVQAENGRLCVAQNAGERGWLGVPEDAPPPDIVRARHVLTGATMLETDYLIVAPDVFHAALAPLVAAREAGGLAVTLVTPEQLYDAYGSGAPDAAAIRRAVLAWHADGNLRYVLLVGDASANPNAMWLPDAPAVPTGWVRTAFVGDTPSDHALVADDDGVPQVAVGRFPASSVDDVEAMVAKTLAWEPNARLLLLNDDSLEFVQMADALAGVQTPDLHLDAGNDDVRRDLLRWLRDGPGTLVYTGHGSLPLLGDEKLLTVEDAGAWDGPTVVVAWTCLCASFTHPQQAGLSEAWLRAPRGTAAFVGPTGETTTGDQSAMALAFHRALADGAALGDALLAGWAASESKDAETSFLLLGDPALQAVPVP